MKISVSLITAGLLKIGAFASGQGGPITATPSDHAHLMAAPSQITLNFPKAINLKGAVFKMYVYALSVMMKGAQMDVFAKAAAPKFLALERDTADRVDTGLIGTKAQTNKVMIGLKKNLKPGIYVTGWNLSSNAQKPSSGFVHFHFETGMMPGSK
jgi:methionine-rich copper-binding protein CopC